MADPRSTALYRRFRAEIDRADVPTARPGPPVTEAPVGEDDLAQLPDVVRRYLQFMRVEGRPRDRTVEARFVGRFRMPRFGWMPAQAWQLDRAPVVGRLFVMRLRVARVLPMVGVDSYLNGRGCMVGKLFDRFTVADGKGDEFDIGELTTYLNDAVLLAPSMLLEPQVAWEEVDDSNFTVALTDSGRTVSARVGIDERGAPTEFVSSDRFADLPGGPVRAPWRTPVESWDTSGVRPIPARASAIWDLPDGPMTYVEGRLRDIRFDAV